MRISMRLWQKRGWYYVEFERGKHKSLKTKDKAEARRLFGIIKREHLAGRLLQLTGDCAKTIQEYYDEFTSWSEKNQPHPTYRANKLALGKLLAVAGGSTRLDRIGPKHMDDIITASRDTGLSVHSINNYIRHSKAALKKAVDWKLLKTNPLGTVKEIRVQKSPPRAIPAADLGRFLSGIKDPDLKSLAAAYIVTGRRRKELFYLKWEDVDFSRGIYRVVAKGGYSQAFPLTDAFRAILEPMRRDLGRVWTRWKYIDTVSKLIKEALRAAGLGDAHLHDLRHSYARMFLEGGGELRELQDMLGHAEYSTTEIYGTLSLDHLLKVANIVTLPEPRGPLK